METCRLGDEDHLDVRARYLLSTYVLRCIYHMCISAQHCYTTSTFTALPFTGSTN